MDLKMIADHLEMAERHPATSRVTYCTGSPRPGKCMWLTAIGFASS
jgi:hypothetical protein